MKEYKARGYYHRYFFVDSSSSPTKCSCKDYEFWKKDFKNIKVFNPKNINGWTEAVYNDFGALVGYKI